MDNEYYQFVGVVVDALRRCEARYAIGGSFASSMYGETRSTYDVDITVQIERQKVPILVEAFLKLDWYIVEETVLDSVQRGGFFQAIDAMTALKADFYAVLPRPSMRQLRTLERARELAYGDGNTAFFMSPEDVILYKLEWYKIGQSPKHLRDIGAMLTTQRGQLDIGYIDRWVEEVGAWEVWHELKARHAKEGDNHDE